jgi:hypothetical protein
MPTKDPNLTRLEQLSDEYQAQLKKLTSIRVQLDAHIQELKRRGYSYPTLTKHSCFAQGTIQLIIAKEA